MSAASHSRTAWFEHNYEKIAVVAVLVGLLLSAAILVFRIRQGHRLLADTSREIPTAHQAPVPPVDLRRIERTEARLITAPTAGTREQRLWVSEIRVHCVGCGKPIRYDANKCPFCGTTQPDIEVKDEGFSSARDTIPDRWKEQHNLDVMDPYLHLRDLDGDGFTVLEEYRAGTDPRDPEDFPPPVMKLRLEGVRRTPFHLVFTGTHELIEGDIRYGINNRQRGTSHFPRLGDTVDGFLLETYDADTRTLLISQGDRHIALRRGEVQPDTDHALVLRSLLDNAEIPTRVGQSFEIRGVSYTILNLRSDGVRVQETDGDRMFTIQALTDEERAVLQRGPDMFGRQEMLPEDEFEIPGMPVRRRPVDGPPDHMIWDGWLPQGE